jgi:hypothetical protein
MGDHERNSASLFFSKRQEMGREIPTGITVERHNIR